MTIKKIKMATLKNIKNHVNIFAHSKGVFIKPIKEMDLRLLRESLQSDSNMPKCDSNSVVRAPTVKARQNSVQYSHQTVLCLERIFDGGVCKNPLSIHFVKCVLCLDKYRGLTGAIALKAVGRDELQVCGIVLHRQLKYNELNLEEDQKDDRTDILDCGDATLFTDAKQNKLADLALLCSNLPGVGRILLAYALWDIRRRKSRGALKYKGVHLTVAGGFQEDTAESWFSSIRSQQNANLYREFTFKECCKPTDKVEVDEDFPDYRMVLHGTDWLVTNLLATFRRQLKLPSALIKACAQSPKCT